MHERRRARLIAYGLAVLGPALTLLVRWPLEAVLGDRVLYMAFFPAVLFAAYQGGAGPGLLATVLSALAASYFLVAPLYSLEIITLPDAVALALFVVVGAVISGMGESLHRARGPLARDITERRKAEQALRLSEQRYRSLAEASVAIVWTTTADGIVVSDQQSSWSNFTGRSLDQLTNWSWLETLHPDDRAHTVECWSTTIANRSVYQVEYRVRRHDGEYRTMLTRGVPIFGEDGQIREWFGTCVDITDLKRAEEALRESEERFRGTFENAAVGIAHVDAQGNILRVNQTLYEIVGYPNAELVGKTIPEVTHPDDLAANLAAVRPLDGRQTTQLQHGEALLPQGWLGRLDVSDGLAPARCGGPASLLHRDRAGHLRPQAA